MAGRILALRTGHSIFSRHISELLLTREYTHSSFSSTTTILLWHAPTVRSERWSSLFGEQQELIPARSCARSYAEISHQRDSSAPALNGHVASQFQTYIS